jgi:hypothetical protein
MIHLNITFPSNFWSVKWTFSLLYNIYIYLSFVTRSAKGISNQLLIMKLWFLVVIILILFLCNPHLTLLEFRERRNGNGVYSVNKVKYEQLTQARTHYVRTNCSYRAFTSDFIKNLQLVLETTRGTIHVHVVEITHRHNNCRWLQWRKPDWTCHEVMRVSAKRNLWKTEWIELHTTVMFCWKPTTLQQSLRMRLTCHAICRGGQFVFYRFSAI